MDFLYKHFLISADLTRMLFFIASAVIGFAMAWVFLQEKLKKTSEMHTTLKDSMDRLIDEYSDYKVSIDKSLADKDEEMLRLNQQLRHNQNLTEARYEKAYKTLQEKVNQLDIENNRLKTSNLKQTDLINRINDLKEQLDLADIKLKKQDVLLMKAKSEAFPREDSSTILAYENKINELKSKIDNLKKATPTKNLEELLLQNKKLKKKYKKLKKNKKNKVKQKAQKIEYVETLDVKKLMDLIESGKLLKRRKSTILSENDGK